jgi:hypothetical protein
MKKAAVEQILIIVKSGQEEALNLKIYRDGTLCRRGCGGIPELAVSGMSLMGHSRFFDQLMATVPDSVLENPIQYQEDNITHSIEYIIGFYGVSQNGETGERAAWSQSTGVHLVLHGNTSVRHPILSFCDSFAMDAAKQTNGWYSDVMIHAIYGHKAQTLPEQSLVSVPKTDAEKWETFSNYVNQIQYSARRWNLASLVQEKTYQARDGHQLRCHLETAGETINIHFLPIEDASNRPKKWWQFW